MLKPFIVQFLTTGDLLDGNNIRTVIRRLTTQMATMPCHIIKRMARGRSMNQKAERSSLLPREWRHTVVSILVALLPSTHLVKPNSRDPSPVLAAVQLNFFLTILQVALYFQMTSRLLYCWGWKTHLWILCRSAVHDPIIRRGAEDLVMTQKMPSSSWDFGFTALAVRWFR